MFSRETVGRSLANAEGGADNAVFNSKTDRIPDNIAAAALAAGLPSALVEQFVGFIASQDQAGAAAVPGATDAIVAAGAAAVLDAYVEAFRYVWLSAIPFLAIALIGKGILRLRKGVAYRDLC